MDNEDKFLIALFCFFVAAFISFVCILQQYRAELSPIAHAMLLLSMSFAVIYALAIIFYMWLKYKEPIKKFIKFKIKT